MKRTTISLSEDLTDALEREARRHSVSSSAIVREALAHHLGVGDRRPLPFAALGRSGYRTTARDMEALLEDEWHDSTRDR